MGIEEKFIHEKKTKGILDTAPRTKTQTGIKQHGFFKDEKKFAVARNVVLMER